MTSFSDLKNAYRLQKDAKCAELIKEYSRMKYGRKKIFVDQEIEDRIGIIR